MRRRAAAELLGTYALVTAGCGAIVVDSTSHALGHGGVDRGARSALDR